MHSPLRGCLHLSAGEIENHGMDYLVVIGFPGAILAPQQLRLMEGEQNVMDINKVQGAERPSENK